MIAKLLLERKAVDIDTDTGFVYASGLKGPIYCDNRILYSYPSDRDQIVDALIGLIKEKQLDADVIAGVASSAIGWGALLADRLKKPLVYVRSFSKDHGKQNQIEGELEEGKSVLVVEDLINSGGSSVSACKTIEQAGGKVKACVAIFNYSHAHAAKNFTEAGFSLYSLADFGDLLKAAEADKYIDDGQKKKLLEWKNDPQGWSP